MTCFILCPECGECLGEVFQFYNVVKSNYTKKMVHFDASKADIKSDFSLKFDFIMNAIQIKKQCCRMHILGYVDFDDIYY